MRPLISFLSLLLVVFLLTACESDTNSQTTVVPSASSLSKSQPSPSSASKIIATPSIQITSTSSEISSTANNLLPIVENPLKAPPKNCAATQVSSDSSIGTFPIHLYRFNGPSATLSLDRPRHTDYGWTWKTLWPLDVSLTDPVTIRGGEVNETTPLWFELINQNPSTSLVLDPKNPLAKPVAGSSEDWNGYPSLVYIPNAGCYYLEAKWASGSWRVTFAVGKNS